MNTTELLILDKVFPPLFKRIITTILHGNNLFHCGKNLYTKSILDVSNDKPCLPVDVDLLIELLQADILIPALENDTIAKSNVFFAMSRKSQHAILQFVNAVQLSTRSFISWHKFLDDHLQQMDEWERVLEERKISVQQQHGRYHDGYSFLLGTDSVKKLQCIKRNHGITEFDQCCNLPPAKKQMMNTSTDLVEIESDGENFISMFVEHDVVLDTNACSASQSKRNTSDLITVKENVKSQYAANSSQIAADIPIKCTLQCENKKPDDIFSSPLSVLTKEEDNENIWTEKGQLNPSALSLLTDCASYEMNKLCIKLELASINEDKLQSFIDQVYECDLPFEKWHCILHHALVLRLIGLNEFVSRNLYNIINKVIVKNERVAITSLLSVLFASPGFCNFQEDIFKKLIANGTLSTDGISMLLNHTLSQNCMVISDSFLSLLEHLFNKKPSISKIAFSNLILTIGDQAGRLTKSLKLMKLLVQIIQAYPDLLFDQKKLVERIVDQNSTFMRKTVLTLFKNASNVVDTSVK